MVSYEVFRSFYSEEEAKGMLDLLSRHGIDARMEKRRPIADKTIAGTTSEHDIFIKIRASDFIRANEIIDEYIESNLSLDNDYYLHDFSDEELVDIIRKPDEWSNQDVIIARKMLVARGIPITDSDVRKIGQERLIELEKPEKVSGSGIIAGYLSAIFPIVGFIFGLVLITSKKVIPNGRKVLVYDIATRQHGTRILAISCFMLIIWLVGIFTRRITYGA